MNTYTPGPWSFRDDFDLVVGPASDPTHNPIAIIHGEPADAFGNAILIAAAPDLLAIVQRIVYDLNGRNATERATNTAHAASPLCAAITALVRDAANVIPNIKESVPSC